MKKLQQYWAFTECETDLTVRVRIDPASDPAVIRNALQSHIRASFGPTAAKMRVVGYYHCRDD